MVSVPNKSSPGKDQTALAMGAAHPIGVVLVAVLIWPNLSLGTFMPVRPPSVTSNNGGYFGNGGGGVGVGPIATDEFHSGGAPIGGPVGSGAGSIVFPGPNDRRAAFFGLLKLPCEFDRRYEYQGEGEFVSQK